MSVRKTKTRVGGLQHRVTQWKSGAHVNHHGPGYGLEASCRQQEVCGFESRPGSPFFSDTREPAVLPSFVAKKRPAHRRGVRLLLAALVSHTAFRGTSH